MATRQLSLRGAAIASALLCAAALAFTVPAPRANSQTSDTPILGYAWSDTVGWIDLNCANSGSCASRTFGLAVAPDGTISGYAWSEHIGWVSAQPSDTANCPSTPCAPTLSNAAATGWLKALGGKQLQAGGWDGWISLNGDHYGLRRDASGQLSGYSWGDMNVGWVDWRYARVGGEVCPVGSVYQGGMCVFSGCPSGYVQQGQQCVIRQCGLQCAGRDLVDSCSGDVIQHCDWGCSYGRCNDAPTLSATLRAVPSLVKRSTSSTISWTSQNAASCTVTGANGDSWTGTSGAKTSKPITARTTYTLRCVGIRDAQPSSIQKNVTLNIAPVFNEI